MIYIFIIALLIIINGFFAMAEIALITVKRSRLQKLKQSGSKQALKTLRLIENSNQFLSTIQIGITFAGFLASAFSAASLSQPLAVIIEKIPAAIIINNSKAIAVILITIFISYLSLVFGELVPKQLALQWSSKISLIVAGPIKLLGQLAAPLVKVLSFSTRIILRLIPGTKGTDKKERITEEDIRALIHDAELIEDIEKEMIEGVFTFGDTRVEEIMTPRTDIVYLKNKDTIQDILQTVSRSGYSRLPVIEETLDNIIGITHIKDIVIELNNQKEITAVEKYSKKPYFIPETKLASELLKEFQKNKIHMAIVINEYGGTAGLITLEDLLEEIVGDIKDEHDREQGQIKSLDNTHISVKGTTDIGYLNRKLKTDLPDTGPYETVAGFILDKLRHIPVPGENIKLNNWTIVITDVNQNRIEQVKFIKNSKDNKR